MFIRQDWRAQIERYMGDPERCMPSERDRLERAGFVAAKGAGMDNKDEALIKIAIDALRAVRLNTMNPQLRGLWDLAIAHIQQTSAEVETAQIRGSRRALRGRSDE